MSGPAGLLLFSVAVPVIGFVAAVLARWLVALRRPPRLGWAASTLCGIVGAAAGASLVALAVNRAVKDIPVAVVLSAVAGTVIVLLSADILAARRTRPQPGALDLMRAGESERVEFKSSARHNLHTGARDARLELVVATTVGGFFNARGGTLLLGVADDATVLGLEEDFRLVRRADRDNYELWLRDLLTTTLGSLAAAAVTIDFETIDGKDVCLLRVPSGRRPVFVRSSKQQRAEFVVRVGNSTRELDARELLEYAAGRWGRRAVARRRVQLRRSADDERDPHAEHGQMRSNPAAASGD